MEEDSYLFIGPLKGIVFTYPKNNLDEIILFGGRETTGNWWLVEMAAILKIPFPQRFIRHIATKALICGMIGFFQKKIQSC